MMNTLLTDGLFYIGILTMATIGVVIGAISLAIVIYVLYLIKREQVKYPLPEHNNDAGDGNIVEPKHHYHKPRACNRQDKKKNIRHDSVEGLYPRNYKNKQKRQYDEFDELPDK